MSYSLHEGEVDFCLRGDYVLKHIPTSSHSIASTGILAHDTDDP